MILKRFILFLLIFIITVYLGWNNGYRINITPSAPIGLWKITGPFNLSKDKGQYAYIIVPNTPVFKEARNRNYLNFGFSKSGIQPLLKKIVGIPGDNVVVSQKGVYINGCLVPQSQPKMTDRSNRILPLAKSVVLNKDSVWAMSDSNENSFDSRYFGPIQVTYLKGVCKPVYVR